MVNRPGSRGFRRDWQKHHLVPRQLLRVRSLAVMLSSVAPRAVWFDDFNANGILLPATEKAAMNNRLPLHRGPHRIYNELVLERVGAVEMEWSQARLRNERKARSAALSRIRLVQRGLARRLKGEGKSPMVLNRRDPIGHGVDFAHLDAMAEALWGATGGNG
ncbi:AHH domain-containing protein [Croceicoccus naphthovorans]|nr:AHH domain-containing protein [Croceicoccus naphthovorans]